MIKYIIERRQGNDKRQKKKSINDKLITALIDFIIGLLLLIIEKMIK